jgi:hypothetical protein
LTLPGNGEQSGSGSAVIGELTTFYTLLDGNTLMGEYEVVDGAVLLASADFGEASAGLDGQVLEAVVARLLLEVAQVAMAQSGERFTRDDETNIIIARGPVCAASGPATAKLCVLAI